MKQNLNKEQSSYWQQLSKEGTLYLDNRKCIINMNTLLSQWFPEMQAGKPVTDYISDTDLTNVLDGQSLFIQLNNRYYSVNGYCLENGGYLLIFYYLQQYEEMEEENERLRNLIMEFQHVIENHSDDLLYVTDAQGNTLWFGESCLKNCNVSAEYLMNKNVREIEREGIFFPSVVVRVLESQKIEVVSQTTATGKQLISIGIPVMDKNGKIQKVIALSKDLNDQIKLGGMLPSINQLLEDLDENTEDPDKFSIFHNLFTCNTEFYNKIVDVIQLAAPTDSTILITGESGSGKEVIADMIQKISKRNDKNFVKVNCSAISPSLIESELFGYETGAFTGAKKNGKIGLIEESNHGTLFLDEIGDLPLDQQGKLLRVLQERSLTRVGGTQPVHLDLRVIAATNRNLKDMVDEGTFRKDLYYRLYVVPIHLPSLRERKQDIPLLIKHFAESFNKKYNLNKIFDQETIDKLATYPWPGNIRELEHAIERIIVTSKHLVITPSSIPDYIKEEISLIHKLELDTEINLSLSLNDLVEAYEKDIIEQAIEKHGSAAKAAVALEVNQSTISRKMKKYGIN